MHKAIFFEGTIDFTITPDGPILIKAGETGGADPTLPDMEFVRSREQIYIPGPSLKGVVRAQCERICRSLDGEQLQRTRQEYRRRLRDDEPVVPLADNPLGSGTRYKGLDDMDYSSGRAIESMNLNEPDRTAVIYRRSSFVSQIFGHTSLAGRVRFADAYPEGELKVEQRNGVAIDRIYGSVAVGPFNYETVVGGTFRTTISFKNLTLAQFALLGLALRDLADGRIAIGFGKSRGLGRVKVDFTALSLYYPTCTLSNGEVRLLSGRRVAAANELVGLGALCADEAYRAYALPEEDRVPLPDGIAYTEDEFLGVRLNVKGNEAVRSLWRACMPAWRREIGL
ncbi:RAMP superfamily CRISPR-associated protein [Roseiflexus sp.]|uniref:RAMP superfamily CRISPR-associated protein n=1 Tax=Roseiflexus sp. TaxID=2562120 RepID=UPI00398AEA58